MIKNVILLLTLSIITAGCALSPPPEGIATPTVFENILVWNQKHPQYKIIAVQGRDFSIKYPSTSTTIISNTFHYGNSSKLMYYLTSTATIDSHVAEHLAITAIMIPAYPGAKAALDTNIENALVIALNAQMQDLQLSAGIENQKRTTWHGEQALEITAKAQSMTLNDQSANDDYLVQAIAIYPKNPQTDNGLLILMVSNPTYSNIDSFKDFETAGTISQILATLTL